MRRIGWYVLAALVVGLVGGYFAYQKDRTFIALAKNIYWEAVTAGEPPIASHMVGYVTLARAAANRPYWGGEDVVEVVYARKHKKNGGIVCQFSWTCMRAASAEPAHAERWRLATHYAQDVLAGNFDPPAHLREATSYLNIKKTGRKNICEFKTRLVYLGKAEPESKHEFYREPHNAKERAALPKRSDVPECKPLAHSTKKKQKTSKAPPRAHHSRRGFLFLPNTIYMVKRERVLQKHEGCDTVCAC